MERLSSGLRINSAGDDAAGLAVSETTKAKVRSRQQAVRNIGDGISALQIADGGMGQIANMLIRMRELAIQAANGTFSDEQRSYLQLEVENLIDGIWETTANTSFNGQYLLRGPIVDVAFMIDTSGSMGGEIAQVRASVGDFYDSFADAGISVRFGLVDSGHDGLDFTDTLADIGDGSFEASLAAMLPTSGAQDPYSVLYNATGLNDIPGFLEPDALHFRAGAARRIIYITDTSKEWAVPGIDPDESRLAAALAADGYTVDFICRLGASWPFDEIAAATGGGLYSIGDAAGSGIPDALDAIAAEVRAALAEDVEPMVIQAGPSEEERIRLGVPVDMTPPTLGVEDVDVGTVEGARRALGLVDVALERLAAGRARVGADLNSLQYALDAQLEQIESDMSSVDRITSADVAEEVSGLVRGKILSQGGYAIKAQVDAMQADTALALVNSGRVPIARG